LAAGLPFAFWPLREDINIHLLQEKIITLVCSKDSRYWPEQILMQRIAESKQLADCEQIWNHTLLLWDDPERLPPDTDYVLTAPE
ncbi:hypothetical protein, partial [Endothiovibrio diazotrophicus]